MDKYIQDFCLGNPQSIATSHSGAIDLAISLQEKSIFLPSLSPESEDPSATSDNGQLGTTESEEASPTPSRSEDASSPPEYNEESVGAVLRGSVVLKLQKPTKIKELGLDLYGVSRTYWNLVPQPGVLGDTPLPSSAEIEDATYFGVHHWDFIAKDQLKSVGSSYAKSTENVSATLVATDQFGANAVVLREEPKKVHQVKDVLVQPSAACQRIRDLPVFTPLKTVCRKLKTITTSAESVMFPAGHYVYHFSIMIDRNCPETTKVPNGNLSYVLAPRLVRAGAFNPNLSGHLEVQVVRAPLTSLGVLVNNPATLCHIWDNRLVYNIQLQQRYLTLDAPMNLQLSLMPLPDSNVMVHQIRIYLVETVKYAYSPELTIRASDSSLRLVLFQKNASVEQTGSSKVFGSLLTSTEPIHFNCNLLVATQSDEPIQNVPQAYGRGKLGEKRFMQPDHTSEFMRVRHRLLVLLRVSKMDPDDTKRHHFEIKVDTPVTVLSQLCVHESIYLPQYDDHDPVGNPDGHGLPTFDDALHHELLSPRADTPQEQEIASGDRSMKFTVTRSTTNDFLTAVQGHRPVDGTPMDSIEDLSTNEASGTSE